MNCATTNVCFVNDEPSFRNGITLGYFTEGGLNVQKYLIGDSFDSHADLF